MSSPGQRQITMGSLSFDTTSCMRMSRIMKFVALVSSSISRHCAPSSSDSMIAAACDVDPLASSEVKDVVGRPWGKFEMKGEMSTCVMLRPSSARILTLDEMLTTCNQVNIVGAREMTCTYMFAPITGYVIIDAHLDGLQQRRLPVVPAANNEVYSNGNPHTANRAGMSRLQSNGHTVRRAKPHC